MRRSRAAVAIALLLGFGATPPVRGSGELARTPIEDALSGIDYLPDHDALSAILGGDLVGLIALANNDDDTVSVGVRIRALRSLGLFDDDLARAGLTTAINRYRNSDVAIEQLYLIAALEGLGDVAGPADVPTISASLSHDRRDVRAAAARALGSTLDAGACSPLQTQRSRETEAQVRLTVDDALRNLGPLCSFGLQ